METVMAGPDSQIHTSSQAHSWEEVFTYFYILMRRLQIEAEVTHQQDYQHFTFQHF